MENKSQMYQNKVSKEFHNNRLIYASYNKEDNIDNKNYFKIIDSNEIRKKINAIINSNDFIYSKIVHINIDNEIIIRRIIGIHDNNLITIDNEYIPIEKIKDIYV